MSEELDILDLVCSQLDLADIPYMLTGSFAANFYAVPRMTRDIDIVIEIDNFNSEKILQIFQSEFYLDKEAIDEAVKYQSMFNIIHNKSIFKIDFIIRKNASYRQIEFERRRQVQLHHIPIWIVSPEDLIISKLMWAKDSFSQMQLKDVKNLLQTIKKLDRDYLDKWVENLELQEIYNAVKLDG